MRDFPPFVVKLNWRNPWSSHGQWNPIALYEGICSTISQLPVILRLQWISSALFKTNFRNKLLYSTAMIQDTVERRRCVFSDTQVKIVRNYYLGFACLSESADNVEEEFNIIISLLRMWFHFMSSFKSLELF